ncbi:MAG: hypothetical protein A2219_00075 [Elusimicrobia bacterium RIFOXYA2_FULL_50_26]|nr:MAG: hypothetical protein A2219_00075 [Elusimicrobia bacterium RIFOXYA2_FULL_50_26]
MKISLIAALFFLGLGGWLLHLRIHPLDEPADYLPFISGVISVIALPVMFSRRGSVGYAYVINGMLAIIGIITMSHFSLAHLAANASFSNIILKSTFPYSVILLGKFMVGKCIFDLEFFPMEEGAARAGRFLRYPNMGWWFVHLAAMTAVYAAGNILWR